MGSRNYIISISSVAALLMIGAPSVQSVLANKADTEQEDGIGADKMGRVCNEGPNHDECHDQFLERTANMTPLTSNQHYGECEEYTRTRT